MTKEGKKNYWNKKIKKILELMGAKKNPLIIDIGCEYGDVTHELYKKGFNINGIDIDREKIKIASERYPSVRFECKNALQMEFDEYDIILAWGLFEYILDLRKFLKKLEKEMKKDAYLIFAVPNACSLRKRIKCVLGFNPDEEKDPHFTYTFREIKNLIKDLKFSKKEMHYIKRDNIMNFSFPSTKKSSNNIICKLIK